MTPRRSLRAKSNGPDGPVGQNCRYGSQEHARDEKERAQQANTDTAAHNAGLAAVGRRGRRSQATSHHGTPCRSNAHRSRQMVCPYSHTVVLPHQITMNVEHRAAEAACTLSGRHTPASRIRSNGMARDEAVRKAASLGALSCSRRAGHDCWIIEHWTTHVRRALQSCAKRCPLLRTRITPH